MNKKLVRIGAIVAALAVPAVAWAASAASGTCPIALFGCCPF